MIRAVYVPGDTPVHRLSAGPKLAALAILACAVGFGAWQAVAVAAVIVAAGWTAARIGMAHLRDTLRPLLIFIAIIFIAQAWLVSAAVGALVIVKLPVVVVGASLVSVTTRVSDMLSVLERLLSPLRVLGVDPEHVSFLIVIAIRFLPALSQIATEVREAQRARGLERNIAAAVVPILIRTLREADSVAEALAARGWAPR